MSIRTKADDGDVNGPVCAQPPGGRPDHCRSVKRKEEEEEEEEEEEAGEEEDERSVISRT